MEILKRHDRLYKEADEIALKIDPNRQLGSSRFASAE
jgi:hypothetical protein